jgi:dTMP kinase
VICDRFVDSSRAYQGGQAGLTDGDILELHRIGSAGLLPDVTVLIEVSPEEASRRTAARDAGNPDRIGARDAAYHAGVASKFHAMAHTEPERFVVIDGNAAPDRVAALIQAAIMPLADRC